VCLSDPLTVRLCLCLRRECEYHRDEFGQQIGLHVEDQGVPTATPVRGLYLCGAGAHPGGGVTGAPGYNAALRVLTDLKRRRDH
jgi:phytoene dehydrogenase-like protein